MSAIAGIRRRAPPRFRAPAWLVALLSPQKPSTGRGKAARKNAKRDEAWARAALDAECAKIANAPTGHRNAALNLGAYNVFQIVWGNPGLLDEEEVRQRLFAAAEACGLVADDGADSVWRTIDSGAEGAQIAAAGAAAGAAGAAGERERRVAVSDWRRASASFGADGERCPGAWHAAGDPADRGRAPSASSTKPRRR